MAREAGLDARFQDVPVPTWRLAGRVFLVERHVNTLVRVASRKFVVDFRPPDAASWSRAKIIGDANAIAQYFGNLGVEQLTAGNPGTAYRLFRRGLEVDPRAASLWINMATPRRRRAARRRRRWRWPETASCRKPGRAIARRSRSIRASLGAR
ncbi:MAG: hypothetical protein IPO61_05645 [Gammaproteobacteria bacterium]|nr:hypothetical protein [Gammaproteobacteria bacterium]